MTFHAPEKYRVTEGRLGSDASFGNNGYFRVKLRRGRHEFFVNVIAGEGEGWEHVSVSRPHQTPDWEIMCAVKALFWDPEDAVMQLHPPKSDYVNFHPHCLHLWRPIGCAIPLPPSWMVGPKRIEEIP
ncbi:DUF7694 domain-containing protein [Pseudomonas schmalbachii]|uniref:DUF7694 domain-containing protein n=1 Tax=Pseudomonas schmalbachii TaxID=2816993 RepID=A0ABS3TM15_9PSED|nr:hypothetical protein [Pseudomonas schmalbachii]MBO3274168.1 hypothetical protein [Pseudomonas schmalbachii]